MSAFDLSATVLALTPTEAGSIPASQGRAAHAFFMRLVAGADPALSARLHETQQVKPFTCSNLWPDARPRPGTPARVSAHRTPY